MSTFQPGDKVRRLSHDYADAVVGVVYTVKSVFSASNMELEEVEGNYMPKHFEMVLLPMVGVLTTTTYRTEQREVTEVRDVRVPVVETRYNLNLSEEDARVVRMGVWLLCATADEQMGSMADGIRIHKELVRAGVGGEKGISDVVKLFYRLEKKLDSLDALSRKFDAVVETRRTASQAVTKPSGWIVQFFSDRLGWQSLVSRRRHYPATEVYDSRNEAYRQMRERANMPGFRPENYRVVPAGTPDGPEPDRGYYTLEVWDGDHNVWIKSSLSFSETRFDKLDQAQDAKARAENLTYGTLTYRIKWHRNK